MQTINDMLFNTSTPEQTDERSKTEIRMEYLIKQGFSRGFMPNCHGLKRI